MSGFVTKSMIAVPLKHVSGRILGVVEVLNRKTNVFTAEDLALVEAVATQIAAVLDNVLLYEELRAQNEALRKAKSDLSNALKDLDLLFETEKAVSSAEKQSDLMDIILARVAPTLGATAAAIFLADPGEQQGALYFKSVVGEKAESLVTLKTQAGAGHRRPRRPDRARPSGWRAPRTTRRTTRASPPGSTSAPTRCSACRSPWTRRWWARWRC